VRPIRDEGAGGAADVHHGVVDGVAEGANIWLGSPSGGADDAWFYKRNAERWKNQDDADEDAERNRSTNRREPGRADRTDQEIRRSQDEISHRESAAKAELVRDGSTKNRQEPDHASEEAGERAGLLGGEVQFFLEVDGQRGERAVVGEALEDFADVGDPERTLEASSNFAQAFREQKRYLRWKLQASCALRPPTIPQPELLFCGWSRRTQ